MIEIEIKIVQVECYVTEVGLHTGIATKGTII